MPKRKRISTALAVLMVTAGAITMATFCTRTEVLAQPEPVRDQEAGSGQMQPPGGPQRRGFGPERDMPRGSGGMPMFAGAGGGVALAAHGDYVYVLRGNTLYQFAAEGLELVKKVTLEDDRPMGPGRRPGMGPGRGPDIGPGRGPEAEPSRPDRPRRPEAEPREGERPERE